MTAQAKEEIRQKVLKAIDETNKNLYERNELAKLIWLTIGANLNILLLGNPGTAKTMIAENLIKAIDNAKIFQYTLNKYTTIDELFGNFDLLALKNENKLKRNISNKLLEADIAYLDEFFKSNSGTLNALLDVMNARVFKDSYGVYSVPLRFLISSSNELPSEEDGLAAVLDRFQVKYLVTPIMDSSTRVKAYVDVHNQKQDIVPVISLDEIDAFRALVDTVKITNEVAEKVEKIYQKLHSESIDVSDRTIFRGLNLAKAEAFLRGSDEVGADDLIVLKDVFWSEVSEIKTVRKVVYSIASPYLEDIEDAYSAIISTYNKMSREISNEKDTGKQSEKQIELIGKIKNAIKSIEKNLKLMEVNGSENIKVAKRKLDEVKELRKKIYLEIDMD